LTISAGFYSFTLRIKVQWRWWLRKYEENPMQDLFQNYVDDVNKLRDAFHDELAAQAQELSKAMDIYTQRSEAALASFMEKVSAHGVEVEAAAAARLNQFRGLPANGGLPDVNDGSLAHTPTNADQVKIETAAERAVAASLEGAERAAGEVSEGDSFGHRRSPDHGPDQVEAGLKTTEVARATGAKGPTTIERLRRLKERGLIKRDPASAAWTAPA
jgi:hypothetical protein